MPVLRKIRQFFDIEDLIPLRDYLEDLPEELDESKIQVLNYKHNYYVCKGLEHLYLAYQQDKKVVKATFIVYDTKTVEFFIQNKVGDFETIADFDSTEEVIESETEVEEVVETEIKVQSEPEIEVEFEPELGGETIQQCINICSESGDYTREECYNLCVEYFKNK